MIEYKIHIKLLLNSVYLILFILSCSDDCNYPNNNNCPPASPRCYIFKPCHNDSLHVGQEIDFFGGFISYNGIRYVTLDLGDTLMIWDQNNFEEIFDFRVIVRHIYKNVGVYNIDLKIKDYENMENLHRITIVIEDSTK